MSVAEQVQYESGVRFRYAVIAFCAALLIVGSQVVQLAGVHAPVSELTLELIAASQRSTLDIVGAVLDMAGLIALGVLLYWLHRVTTARRPETKGFIRWLVAIGAGLSAIVAITDQIVVANKAHTFVTTGSQSYPEANHLTSSGAILILPLLLEFATLLLAIGIILSSLSALRVGLVTRLVGYAGVIAGALFVFPIQGLAPLIEGFWLAAVSVTLAARWPSGDPPAWEAGVAVPWLSTPPPARQESRAQRRRRVSDSEVLAAVDKDTPKVAKSAGRAKRKRRR